MDLDGAPADRQVYITPAFRKCGRSTCMEKKTKNSERAIPEFKNPLSPGEKCLKPQTSYPFDVASKTWIPRKAAQGNIKTPQKFRIQNIHAIFPPPPHFKTFFFFK